MVRVAQLVRALGCGPRGCDISEPIEVGVRMIDSLLTVGTGQRVGIFAGSGVSEILSLFLYHQAFNYYKFGYASATAVIFMLIIASITLLQFRILRANRVNY